MPRPPIKLSEQDMELILENKPGIFPEEPSMNFLDLNPDRSGKTSFPPVPLNKLIENFQTTVINGAFDENLNTGLYIRLSELIPILQSFENEKGEDGKGLTHVHIGFGLREAKRDENNLETDWNCIHLIMEGATPVAKFEPGTEDTGHPIGVSPLRVSKTRYSTYDGDENNYVGLKPGTPPFGTKK